MRGGEATWSLQQAPQCHLMAAHLHPFSLKCEHGPSVPFAGLTLKCSQGQARFRHWGAALDNPGGAGTCPSTLCWQVED